MSLRTLPSSERAFATFVVLALGAFLLLVALLVNVGLYALQREAR